jgi:hypothetical protein
MFPNGLIYQVITKKKIIKHNLKDVCIYMPRHKQFPIDLALVIFLTLLCIPFVLVRSALKRNFAGKDYLGFTVGALSTRLGASRYLIPEKR